MLKSIKTSRCPICGCSDIIEERIQTSSCIRPEINQHTNGTRWEFRKFLCGYSVQYEPNYLKEMESDSSECFYDPKVIARKAKEKKDKEKMIELLEKNNISEKLIDRVKMHCLY